MCLFVLWLFSLVLLILWLLIDIRVFCIYTHARGEKVDKKTGRWKNAHARTAFEKRFDCQCRRSSWVWSYLALIFSACIQMPSALCTQTILKCLRLSFAGLPAECICHRVHDITSNLLYWSLRISNFFHVYFHLSAMAYLCFFHLPSLSPFSSCPH